MQPFFYRTAGSDEHWDFITHTIRQQRRSHPHRNRAITMTNHQPWLPGLRALVPLPTQLIPTDRKVNFRSRKIRLLQNLGDFRRKCRRGQYQQCGYQSHPFGWIGDNGMILPLKGVERITLDGSKETDRVDNCKDSSGERHTGSMTTWSLHEIAFEQKRSTMADTFIFKKHHPG